MLRVSIVDSSEEVVTFELDCTYLFQELFDPVHTFLDLAARRLARLNLLLVNVGHLGHLLVGQGH